MNPLRKVLLAVALLAFAGPKSLFAETCQTKNELSPADLSAIESTASRFSQYAISGDAASLRQNAIGNLAGNFAAIENTIAQNKPKLAGGQANVHFVYLLDASQAKSTIDSAQFYCGLYNGSGSVQVSFTLPNLPPGKYAVSIVDVKDSKEPYHLTYVLQQDAGVWKLAGFFAHPTTAAGKDGLWYWTTARQYKAKNENHNAYFYYVTAQDLLAPVPFISSTNLDKLVSEEQAIQPKDIPLDQPVVLNLSGKTYKVKQIFPVNDDKEGLDLVVKYDVPDISNQGQIFQQNMEMIKAFVARYPEYKSSFNAVVARAVAPSGQDFGTMLAMKDIR